MNILVIGNGFDLSHGLPTKYEDFLGFCERIRALYSYDELRSYNEYNPSKKAEYIYAYIQQYFDDWKTNERIKKRILDFFLVKYKTGSVLFDKILDEFNAYTNDNTWINYFLHCTSYIGENWIDFESEISKVIQSLDEARVNIINGISVVTIRGEKANILIAICKAAKWTVLEALKNIEDIDKFSDFLNAELEHMIRALEIYIAEFVNKITVSKKNMDIEKINIDHLLSFNYSDTYERVYGTGKIIECNYIHGKADINKNVHSCNLVLGIDEYLDDDRKNKELSMLSFKKYYQRIYKSTENLYLNWLDTIKEEYADYKNSNILSGAKKCSEHILYIFGHSLDVTDKDILSLLICNDNVRTKIFYYRKHEDDKKGIGKLIKNLIRIMGPDELIRRTGGIHKTIEFIPQTILY